LSSRALEKNQIVNTERNGIYEIFIVAKSTENSITFNNSNINLYVFLRVDGH